jgi:HK97 family phage portal protein
MPSFLSRLVFKQAPEVVPVPTGVESAIGGTVTFERDNMIMLREYYRSIYMWRCVDMIAQMSSSIVLDVAPLSNRALSEEEKAVDRLIKKPNPQWTAAALQYFVAASLAVANRCYLQKVRSEIGRNVLELWPIPANEVTTRYRNGTQVIEAFVRSTATGIKVFPVDDNGDSDMIFIRRPVLNHASDKSPASVAVPPAETFTRILQRCYDIVSNASNITGVLSTEAELGKQVVKDVKSEVQRFRTGAAESGGMLVTANAKWQMTRLSEDPATALSVEIKDSLARDVCMTFGVPTQLVGLPGTDTYNNLALARVGLLTDTVLPGYVNLYVSSLNDAFMDDPGTGERTAMIKPNTAAIPSMAASRLQLVDTAVKATMLTLNEQRALLGFPPYEDDEADVPVLLEELRIKRLQVESGAGNVADQMANEPG